MAVKKEKCTEEIKVHLGAKLKEDLKELCWQSGHDSLSTYIRRVLQKHCYGHLNPNKDILVGTVRD